MNISGRTLAGIAATALLVGCAGQTEQLTMQTPPAAGAGQSAPKPE